MREEHKGNVSENISKKYVGLSEIQKFGTSKFLIAAFILLFITYVVLRSKEAKKVKLAWRFNSNGRNNKHILERTVLGSGHLENRGDGRTTLKLT